MPITLIDRATSHASRIAIIDDTGQYTYHRLLSGSGAVALGADALLPATRPATRPKVSRP